MDSQSLEYVNCEQPEASEIKSDLNGRIYEETNCLSQTDNSCSINWMLRRIMEQNLSEAGSSS